MHWWDPYAPELTELLPFAGIPAHAYSVASGESLQVFVLDFSGEIDTGMREECAEVIPS